MTILRRASSSSRLARRAAIYTYGYTHASNQFVSMDTFAYVTHSAFGSVVAHTVPNSRAEAASGRTGTPGNEGVESHTCSMVSAGMAFVSKGPEIRSVG